MSGSTLTTSFPTVEIGDRSDVDRDGACKICGSEELVVFEHTARCTSCGVLLFFPYPAAEMLVPKGDRQALWLKWYCESGFRNARNFTNMILFALGDYPAERDLAMLDYGGGGGQFAFTALTHFPRATVAITDLDDAALLPQYQCANHQIPFNQFEQDARRFDVIFMNDVFEHVEKPQETLAVLAAKLRPGGRIFVDTPKTFWLYPILRTMCPPLYSKLCRGTVTRAHLQIWSHRSFQHAVQAASLRVVRYAEASEFTMPPDFYLNSMAIKNPAIRLAGRLFYSTAHWLARNKILAVLEPR